MQGLNDGSSCASPSSSQPISDARQRTLPSAGAHISIGGDLPQADLENTGDDEDSAMLTSPHVESDARGSDHPEEELYDRSKRVRLSSSPSEGGYQGKKFSCL